jgi:ATP-dependent Clp protease ATP-binding subunit ClpB
MLDRAEKEARDLKDEYVSTEHLLLALAEKKASPRRDLLSGRARAARRCCRRWSRCAVRTG